MTLKLPTDVLTILNALQKSGYQAYIVGGAVRDVLMHPDNQPTDWDFTTDATPEQIMEVFPESFYENEFGTVAITREHVAEQFGLNIEDRGSRIEDQVGSKVIEMETATKIHESLIQDSSGQIPDSSDKTPEPRTQNLEPTKDYRLKTKDLLEITTFRSDGQYTDFRRPDSVTWGKSLDEDLQRRDFTINAMGIQVQGSGFKVQDDTKDYRLESKDYQLIDPHGGQADLKNAVIKTVGDPNTRFQEDALRMLRAIRFSVQLNFAIDDSTWEAIVQHAPLLQHVSGERIRDEFLKMLGSDFPKEAIELLDETGLLEFVLPELLEAKGVEQGGHHNTDVWTHSIDALANCGSKDPIVRLATLLHDIAKPRTFNMINGKITFYNHEIVGSRMAKKIAERLRLSRKDIQRVFILVRHHMFYYQPHNTDASIRRFMRKVGLENINDIIDLRIGDRLGSGARETSWRFEEMKERMKEQLHQPFAIKDLAIDGNMLIEELGMKPGPEIGKVLNSLFEEVVENPELNEKQVLMEKARELVG